MVEDRSIKVPPGFTVMCARVPIDQIKLANRTRMDFAAIERKGNKLLQQGDCDSFPPPNGQWEGDRFVIYDGRHEFLAAYALGRETLLVAWLQEEKVTPQLQLVSA
jgi:hypothetical protein